MDCVGGGNLSLLCHLLLGRGHQCIICLHCLRRQLQRERASERESDSERGCVCMREGTLHTAALHIRHTHTHTHTGYTRVHYTRLPCTYVSKHRAAAVFANALCVCVCVSCVCVCVCACVCVYVQAVCATCKAACNGPTAYSPAALALVSFLASLFLSSSPLSLALSLSPPFLPPSLSRSLSLQPRLSSPPSQTPFKPSFLTDTQSCARTAPPPPTHTPCRDA